MGYAKSIMDYIGRWLQFRFLEGEQLPLFPPPHSRDYIRRRPQAGSGGHPVWRRSHLPHLWLDCLVSGTCHMCPECATSVGGCS